jgi:hypothetical protein
MASINGIYMKTIIRLFSSVPYQSLFQSELSTHCDLEFPHSYEGILSFPYGLTVHSYVFFLIFPTLLSLLLSFLQ